MRVVVVGQGYVGLPLAIRAAEVGHEVIGYDVDARRIKRLAAGESFVEDVSSERIRAALDNGTYRASESARDCGGFDIAVVTVPTPLHEGTPTCGTSRSRRSPWPAICAPGRRSSWSRRPIPAPPRSCSRRSWRRARA